MTTIHPADSSLETSGHRAPLTPLQEGIALQYLADVGGPSPLKQVVMAWDASCPEGALDAAWRKVGETHRQLKMALGGLAAGEWRQDEWPDAIIVPERIVLPQETNESKEAILERFLEQDRRKGFDLTRAPLCRVSLVRIRDQAWLVWTVHQFLVDSASLALVLADVFRFSRDVMTTDLGRLSPRSQFTGSVGTSRLSGEEEQAWRSYLAGGARMSAMPLRRAAPSAEAGVCRLQWCSQYLERSVGEELRRGSTEGGWSLRTLFEATWAILLQRFSGEEDILFGVSRDGRLAGDGHVVGQFLSVIPLRLAVNPELRLRPWLLENDRRSRAMEATAGVGWDAIRRLSDLPKTGPVLDVLLHYEPLSLRRRLEGALGQTLGRDVTVLKQSGLPLTITVEDDDLFRLELTYNARHLTGESAERLLGLWQRLLASVAEDSDRLVGELEWLTASDGEGLWRQGRGESVGVVGGLRVDRRVDESCVSGPEVAAVMLGAESLTYAGLEARSAAVARGLRNLRVGEGDRVAICCERSIDMVVGVLGILRAGAAYVPLDPAYPEARLAMIVEEAAPRVMLTQRRWLERLPGCGATQLCLDDPQIWGGEGAGHGRTGDAERAVGAGDSLAYVMYTSGSTGRPKGVAMGHGALVNLLSWQQTTLPLAAGTRVLQYASLSFDVSFQEIFSTWQAGGTLVLVSEELRRDPVALLRYLEAERIERIFLPFVALQQLAEAAAMEPMAPQSMSDVVTAGEQLQVTPMIRALFRRWQGARLHNHYGPTESHVITSHTLEGDPALWPDLPPIGKPIFNTEVHLLDGLGRILPEGVPGEIYLGGAALAQGYLHREDLTAERFLRLRAGDQGWIRLYRTGDLGWRGKDGNVGYLGRVDDQVKIRGFRVELGEVESVLRQLDGVGAAAVKVQTHRGEKRLVAYVVRSDRERSALDIRELREELRRRLPDYLVPAVFQVIDRLPLTPSGKINRKALPDPETEMVPEAGERHVPANETEVVLEDIWKSVLGLGQVGRNVNFFDIGGSSLRMVQVQRLIRERLGKEIPVARLFQNPTIRSLAAQFVGTGGSAAALARLKSSVQARAALQRRAQSRGRDPAAIPSG
jgi:amino acid adenylation domain-containing protein